MNQPVLTNPQPRTPIGATVLGYPRIGRQRELKKALERLWGAQAADSPDVLAQATALERTAAAVRSDALDAMEAAGLDTVPVNTFSWYDQVLDTAVLVGAVPERFRSVSSTLRVAGFDAARYFAMARGTAKITPLEMTKWFDTNYHYLVPEIDATTPFVLDAAKPLTEYNEAIKRDLDARPVVVGPWTFLRLAKMAEGAPVGFSPLDRLEELTEVYAELLSTLADAGVPWVQLDEPAAVRDLTSGEAAELERVYARLSAVEKRPAILVATYFAAPVEALPGLCRTGVEAISLDLTRGVDLEEVAGTPGLLDKALVLGAVNGRNIWRTDLSSALVLLEEWEGIASSLSVSTSCSLLHVPYDVDAEPSLDPRLKGILAFAVQKLDEVVALQRALARERLTGEGQHGAHRVRPLRRHHRAAEHP